MSGKFCEQLVPLRLNCLKLNKKNLILSLFLFVVGIFLLPETAYLSSISSEKILELTNYERQKANLHTLENSPLLKEAAQRKIESILEEQTFKHNIKGRKFSEWIKDVGYDYFYVGENLAMDFITAEGAVKAWMESESHKKNLLDKTYLETGIAVIQGKFEDSQTTIIAQIFGTPAKIQIPAKISRRREKIVPAKKTILSAREKAFNILSFKKDQAVDNTKNYLSYQRSTSSAERLSIAFSLFLSLMFTFMYIYSLEYLIKHHPPK